MCSQRFGRGAAFSEANTLLPQRASQVYCSSLRRKSLQVLKQERASALATTDYTISTLPANVEAERSILGAILLDNLAYNQAAEHLRVEDFSLDSHRRSYSRMME